MPVITVTSAERGVFKTLSAAHLAHGLAITGLRTLALDLGASAELSELFACLRKHTSHLLSPQQGQQPGFCLRRLLHRDIRPELDVVPYTIEAFHTRRQAASKQHIPSLGISLLEFRKEYDAVVIDAEPRYQDIIKDTYHVSDILVIPITADPASSYSLHDVLSVLRNFNHKPKLRFLLLRSSGDHPATERRIKDRVELLREQLLYDFQHNASLSSVLEEARILSAPVRIPKDVQELYRKQLTAFDEELNDLEQIVSGQIREKGLSARAISSLAADYIAVAEELSNEALPVGTPLNRPQHDTSEDAAYEQSIRIA